MASTFNKTLFKEDWSAFKLGNLHRDMSARGEYMTMVVPDNPGGWYTNAGPKGPAMKNKGDKNHSPVNIKKTKKGRIVEMPGRTHEYCVVLTTGEKNWKDFEVTTEAYIKDILPLGVVARYKTNRDFYAAIFESGVFKLVRMLEGSVTILASSGWNKKDKSAKISLKVEGNKLTAKAGKVKLEAEDGTIVSGGTGLWMNGPAQFGPVTVKSSAKEISRIEKEQKKQITVIARKQKQYPSMELVAEVNIKGHSIGRQIRFADLNGDGRDDILFAVPTYHKGKKWQYNKIGMLTALNMDGDVLWKKGKFPKDATDITADLPFQAADRGKGMEVVASFGWNLETIDPLTGKTIKKIKTPKAPKMEDYWDEINMYFGDGHGDDIPNLIPDSIRFCNFRGKHKYGDFYIKDRYHNLWAMNGETLKPLWHHAANSGHHPFTCDLTGDGKDDVLHGYSRLDSKGNLIGRLFLSDHPDGCFSYVDANGFRRNVHPCGEAGLVEEYDDWRVMELHFGHVQHLSIANFIQDRPDLERLIVTYHGNEGIIVMLDTDGRVIRKQEHYGSGAICQPTNWTGDGKELIAFSAKHDIGGLWDENFDLVVPFPDNNRPGKYMEIQDVLGLGVDQVVVWDEEKLHVYAPNSVKKSKKKYAPVRQHPNSSNYQVNYSLPEWK